MQLASHRVWLSMVVLFTVGVSTVVIINSCSDRSQNNKRNSFLHGIWVDTYYPGLKSKEEAEKLVDDVKRVGINSLFIQTRRRGDLLTKSKIEPSILSSNDWEPVSFLKENANDLQLHAWIVCGPVWNQRELDELPKDHILIKHPEWIMLRDDGESFKDGEYYLDLGLPEVQHYLLSVISEIALSGKFNGIHLDYIRYPGRRWGYHPKVLEEFYSLSKTREKPAHDDPLWMSFRRQKISDLVELIFAKIKNINPELILSAATITHAPGPEKQSDWFNSSAHGYLFQDWVAWLDREIVDWIIPMVYFQQEMHAHHLNKWVNYISELPNSKRVALGFGLFLNDKSYNIQQIANTFFSPKNEFNFLGFVGFSYANPVKKGEGIDLNFEQKYPKVLTHKMTGLASGAEDVIPPKAIPISRGKNGKSVGHLGFYINDPKIITINNQFSIELYKKTELIRKLNLNSTGFCLFRNLSPGQYKVNIFKVSIDKGKALLYSSIEGVIVRKGEVKLIETLE